MAFPNRDAKTVLPDRVLKRVTERGKNRMDASTGWEIAALPTERQRDRNKATVAAMPIKPGSAG